MAKGNWKPTSTGAKYHRCGMLKGLFQRRLQMALDPNAPRLHAPLKTLADMTEEEIQELEAKYNCPVIQPVTKE